MTAVLDTRTEQQPVRVVPVRHGDREIGAYVVDAHGARFVPAVDVVRVVTASLTAAAAATTAVAAAVALRRRPVIGTVSMGPGGWVSIRRTGVPPLRAARRGTAARRPWWARVLRARRLVVQR